MIHPNKIKQLGVGEAVLITKNPHATQLVAVEREARAEELMGEDERRVA